MGVFNVVIWFTVLGISSAFLMQDIVNKTSSVSNSGHSSTDTTDETIHALMIFMAEEKTLRYQLEQRLDEAEKKLHIFDQFHDAVTAELQHERDTNKRLEQTVYNTTRSINTLIGELQQERYTIQRLEQRLNSTNSSIDAVTATNSRLEQIMQNTTSSINVDIQHQRDLIDRLESKYNTNSTINRYDHSVAFSVNSPVVGYPLRFSTANLNMGGAYNISTGKLVCNQPGIYFLTYTLIQNGSGASRYCCVDINNVRQGNSCTITGGGSGNYPSGSQSVIVRLHMNDEVLLSCDNGNDGFEGHSSFAGFLVQPEN